MANQSPKDYLVPSVKIPEEFHKKNFLILKGREHRSGDYSYSYPDLCVAKYFSHHGKNWSDSHAGLHAEGFQMLTLRQFVDFLALLKSGKAFDGRGKKVSSRELEMILREIFVGREPQRAEHLDARFKEEASGLYIYYEHSIINGQLVPQRSEPLLPHLSERDFYFHDMYLKEYLEHATAQGLPSFGNSCSGSLHYHSPRNGMTAWFGADGSGTHLNGWTWSEKGVTDTNILFRVRRARVKE